MKKDEATPQEIWKTLKGVSEKQDQLVASQRETGRQRREGYRELKEAIKETGRQIKETGRQFREERKTAEKRLKEIDKLFTDHWGKLIKALAKGDLIKLLNERNISLNHLSQEHERNIDGEQYNFHIIALNSKEVVVVEVSTTLKLKDMNHFIKKFKMFKDTFKEYKNRKVYGAVAYLKARKGTEVRYQREGLFVIRATENSSSIINKLNFKPKSF